jgi:hypothetical protein
VSFILGSDRPSLQWQHHVTKILHPLDFHQQTSVFSKAKAVFFFTQPDPKNLAPPIAVGTSRWTADPQTVLRSLVAVGDFNILLAALIRFD